MYSDNSSRQDLINYVLCFMIYIIYIPLIFFLSKTAFNINRTADQHLEKQMNRISLTIIDSC